MKTLTKILAGGAGFAALAAAAPASSQYYPYQTYQRFQPSPYGSYGTYGAYGNQGYAMNSQYATQQCMSQVQNRLYTRTGLTGVIGSLFGVTGAQPRVLSITRVTPNRSYMRVRGLATSGRYAYNNYGVGYYGALGAGYTPDLSFRCDVDYNGNVRDVRLFPSTP